MQAQDEARIRKQLQHIEQWRTSGLPLLRPQPAALRQGQLHTAGAGGV